MTAPGFTHSIRHRTSGSGSGVPGPQGDSAYQVAINNGFVGTEQEWLASLQGPPGSSVLAPTTFVQNTPSATWSYLHQFPYRPIVVIYDNNGSQIEADVSYPSSDVVQIAFAYEMTGVVELF